VRQNVADWVTEFSDDHHRTHLIYLWTAPLPKQTVAPTDFLTFVSDNVLLSIAIVSIGIAVFLWAFQRVFGKVRIKLSIDRASVGPMPPTL